MNRRLQQFLAAENMSQSQLADTLGVARASISHILAGRNKPGFDFIESMSSHFPNLNLEWLISGKGKIYKTGDNRSEAGSSQPVIKPVGELFSDDYQEDMPASNIPSIPAIEKVVVKAPVTQTAKTHINTSNESTQKAVSKKDISKIVIFYSDSTFEVFNN